VGVNVNENEEKATELRQVLGERPHRTSRVSSCCFGGERAQEKQKMTTPDSCEFLQNRNSSKAESSKPLQMQEYQQMASVRHMPMLPTLNPNPSTTKCMKRVKKKKKKGH